MTVIGITGLKRSGKDTVANILIEERGFERVSFADTLKQMAYDINPLVGISYENLGYKQVAVDQTYLQEMVDDYGWEKAKEHSEVRRFLQRLGTEGVRNNLGENVWIDNWLEKVNDRPEVDIVTPDARFINEADVIRECDGLVWRVVRPGYDQGADLHPSEVEQDSIEVDVEIVNDGDLDDLRERVLDALAWEVAA